MIIMNTKSRRGLTKKERKKKKKYIIRNKKLVKKYYWLVPRNVWTGRILDNYDYTWVDWLLPYGWERAFGKMLMEELGEAVRESGQKNFQIVQMKEKFGQLRIYCNGGRKIDDIIDKYTHISENICINCGKEAPMTDNGWLSPRCFNCFCKTQKKQMKYYPEMKPSTEEELREQYKKIVIETPDENGEYHMPTTYTMRVYFKNEYKNVTYDISDTVKKIQKRIKKYG